MHETGRLESSWRVTLSLPYFFSRLLIKIFLIVFYRFTVVGKENIPEAGGFIIAPNHVSYLDPPVTGSALSRQVVFMAVDYLFETPLLKYWIRGMGCLRVTRGVANRKALNEAIERLKGGECVCIFPEGTRVAPGQTTPAQAGIALMADKANVPVVPMAILGTQPWHRTYFGFIPWFSKIRVRIGGPMRYPSGKNHHEFANEILDEIRRLKQS